MHPRDLASKFLYQPLNLPNFSRKSDSNAASTWKLYFARLMRSQQSQGPLLPRKSDASDYKLACVKLTASSANRKRRSVDSSTTVVASNAKIFDASCVSNCRICVLLHDNVYSRALTRTSRMDAILISSTPRVAKDDESTTDQGQNSLTTYHALGRQL